MMSYFRLGQVFSLVCEGTLRLWCLPNGAYCLGEVVPLSQTPINYITNKFNHFLWSYVIMCAISHRTLFPSVFIVHCSFAKSLVEGTPTYVPSSHSHQHIDLGQYIMWDTPRGRISYVPTSRYRGLTLAWYGLWNHRLCRMVLVYRSSEYSMGWGGGVGEKPFNWKQSIPVTRLIIR